MRNVSKRQLAIALSLTIIAFVVVASYATARWRLAKTNLLRELIYDGDWIRSPDASSHAAYFRKRFDLTGAVRHAWIRIAAEDAFEVSVNRNPLGRQYLWRPTRPFQSGVSEKGQVLLHQDPALALNFPRDYQWDGHDNFRVPYFIDITSALNTGKNVIAIELESRSAPARTHFVGEIVLWSGEVIPIRSDSTWKSEPVPIGPQLLDWTETFYWDQDWRQAVQCPGPTTHGIRSLPEAIFTEPFTGDWIRARDVDSKDEIRFTLQWQVVGQVDEAWFRLMANRSYELFVNDRRVTVASIKPPDLDNGDWVLGRGTALDPRANPELLDPDEVGASFIGKSFESPREAAPGLEQFKNPFSPKITPFVYERTHHRAQEAGVIEPKRTLAESRRTPDKPDLFPELAVPNALKRELGTGGFMSYSIANLLVAGDNTIEVRCLGKQDASWPSQIAVDGGVRLRSGEVFALPKSEQWQASAPSDNLTATSAFHPSQPVSVVGPAQRFGESRLAMQYRGHAIHPARFSTLFPQSMLEIGWATIAFISLFLLLARLQERRLRRKRSAVLVGDVHGDLSVVRTTAQMLLAILLSATVTLGIGMMLEMSWIERHEAIWFLSGQAWEVVFGATALVASVVALVDFVGRAASEKTRIRGRGISGKFRSLPDSRAWFHLLLWVAVLAFVVRAYKLDLQPLDDDEYASVQAILSIMENGTPSFVPDDIYYTRSPLYHYLTAALAWPFGGNLWSLRLQSIAFGVATAWLSYLVAAKLMGSRWVGFFSMLFVALHPYEIFTSHVIRFYQMQQFFALLTMYCFCRGFVTEQRQGYRIATIVTFLLAVLSQEITIAMGPSIVLGYLIFAKDLGWKKNIQLGLLSLVVVAIIGLDFLVFQTLCLTRTEGVSPSIEASVKPHFGYPMNLLSILIGYSRLHVIPSLFLLLGLPLLWREQNRNTLALLSFLATGIVLTNLLVTNVSLRYLYWLFPIWIVLSVDGMRLCFATLIAWLYPPDASQNRYVMSLGTCMAIGVLGIVCSWSPWRIPGSYELRILGDSTGALRWIESQKREGDRVAVSEPHTHCAFLEAGKCDYDLAIPLLYDFAVVRDGVLVDRNGGGQVVSNVDQLIAVLSKGERVWIAINREKFRTRGKNLRWEYPGARFEEFIRKNCELKHRTYLWSVFLWDPARGHYRAFQQQE